MILIATLIFKILKGTFIIMYYIATLNIMIPIIIITRMILKKIFPSKLLSNTIKYFCKVWQQHIKPGLKLFKKVLLLNTKLNAWLK
jgi:hypothetical protein